MKLLGENGCPHCGEPVLLVEDLAPMEQLGAVLAGESMCARHWSNFAQGVANETGLTLLRAEDAGNARPMSRFRCQAEGRERRA